MIFSQGLALALPQKATADATALRFAPVGLIYYYLSNAKIDRVVFCDTVRE